MNTFDFDTLREMVAAKKRREGLTYRSAMLEIGVEYHTLWHFLNKHGKPEAEHCFKMILWLGLSPDRFCGDKTEGQTGKANDTLGNIKDALRTDASLKTEDVDKLMSILRSAYKALVS